MEQKQMTNNQTEYKLEVTNIDDKLVYIKAHGFRFDVVEVFRNTPGRRYNDVLKVNVIPLATYATWLKEMEKLKVNVQDNGFGIQIQDKLYAPDWTIELTPKFIKCTPKHGINGHLLDSIPGTVLKYDGYNYDKRWVEVPLQEAYQLASFFADIEDNAKTKTDQNVVWTDEAHKFVIDQLEERSKIDKIAKLEDIEYKVPHFEANNIELRNFQKVGCAFVEETNYKALIADQVGLGKTIQSIAPVLKNNLKAIVICPAHLIPNWTRQLLKFTGQHPLILSGRIPSDEMMVDMVVSKHQFTIISYTAIAGSEEDADTGRLSFDGHKIKQEGKEFPWITIINMCFRQGRYDIAILDECHYAKNEGSSRTQAIERLSVKKAICMSATPVTNRPGDYFTTLHLLRPELFPSRDRFLRNYTWDGKQPKNVQELQSMLKGIMIRRKKTEVMKELPPINRIEEYTELTPKAKKLYDKVLQGLYEIVNEFDPSKNMTKEVVGILAQLQRLKQVCAISKMDFTANLANELYDGSEGASHRKTLIYSQYVGVVKGIAGRLREDGCLYITGEHSPSERMKIIDEYTKNDKIHHLVVSLKAGGTGLDITAAGYVIFNDMWWTPAEHEQAEGRAYGRLNDAHSIDAYYVVANDTIEAWILEILAAKLKIIDQVVEGVEAARDTNIAMMIIQRLKQSMWRK